MEIFSLVLKYDGVVQDWGRAACLSLLKASSTHWDLHEDVLGTAMGH